MTRIVFIRKRTRNGGIQAFEAVSVPDAAPGVAPSSSNPAPGVLSGSDTSGEDERVGFKRPPRKHRFKPGQSGNPKGRPRRRLSMQDCLRQRLVELVPITIDGKKRKLPVTEVIVEQMIQKAMRGDPKYVTLIMKLASNLEAQDNVEDKRAPDLTESDLRAYEALVTEQFEQAGLSAEHSNTALAIIKQLAGTEGAAREQEEDGK